MFHFWNHFILLNANILCFSIGNRALSEKDESAATNESLESQMALVPSTRNVRNPFLNIFSNHHQNQDGNNNNGGGGGGQQQMILLNNLTTIHSNQLAEPSFIDYSSESLLNYCREGNLNAVKEILLNADFNVNKKYAFALSTKLDEEESHYNTLSGEVNIQQQNRVKIDIELSDEV